MSAKISIFCLLILYILSNAVAVDSSKWIAKFDPSPLTVKMHQTQTVKLFLTKSNSSETFDSKKILITVASDSELITISEFHQLESTPSSINGTFEVNGVFLGKTPIRAFVDENGVPVELSDTLPVIIVREVRLIDNLFTISVATLVSILYINFGAALDMNKVKASFTRPIGPCLALFCHFLVLPLAAYGLGVLLFPDNVEMQLGLFFTGVSPAGGASNIWTVILGGNIDLSVAMTATSTFAAFGLMPLWIFTLGKVIFDRGNLAVPYRQIASYAFALIVPLGIGLLIQRRCPRVSRILVRILKPLSSLLIVFIVVFAIITNLYLFKLFTWQIFIAGIALPWIGYFVGWLTARCFRQEYEDRLAIAVEAGIQNTGIAIFILRFALSQPEADLTTVVPVSVAIMTPFPLIAYLLCYKGREWFRRRADRRLPQEVKECIASQGNNSNTF